MQTLDAEKFKTSLWSNLKSTFSFEEEEWMQQSYQNPIPFWTSLAALQKRKSPHPPSSILNKSYNFYDDCVTRHAEGDTAFIFSEKGESMTPWSYKKLHRLVNFQIRRWQKYALKPGQLVVIAIPTSPAFWLALLTSLRLGLTICYLPVQPSLLPAHRVATYIEQVNPDFVIVDSSVQISLPTNRSMIQVEELIEDDGYQLPPAYSYPASQTLQLSLSLYRSEPYAIVPLDAQTCYLQALRDGLLTLNLQPDVAWAAPLSCPLRSQSWSTITSLLCGATFVHIAENVIREDPSILKNEKVHLLGISSHLQALWRREACIPKSLKAYYTDFQTLSSQEWKFFTQLHGLEKTPLFQLLVDNSLGGIALFSKPTLSEPNLYFRPSLGTPWALRDLNKKAENSITGFGQFHLSLPPQEKSPRSNFIVSQIEKECLVSSAFAPTRHGITVPTEPIEDAVSQLDFATSCMLYLAPKIGPFLSSQLVLLVFVDPLQNDLPDALKHEWTQKINHQISDKIGTHFLPDALEYYPLIPKMKGSSIDRDWCTQQYQQGLLSIKKSTQIYYFINALKKLAKELAIGK